MKTLKIIFFIIAKNAKIQVQKLVLSFCPYKNEAYGVYFNLKALNKRLLKGYRKLILIKKHLNLPKSFN